MPNYFDEYQTTVYFITEEELKANHSGMPHGGFVIRTGITGKTPNNALNSISIWKAILNLLPEY
jgi:diaminopimelate dehydrogenase